MYLDFIPGLNTMTIYGLFLINLTITVGGLEAERVDYYLDTPTWDQFVLPLVTPYNYTALYDVVVSSYSGTVVLPGAVV